MKDMMDGFGGTIEMGELVTREQSAGRLLSQCFRRRCMRGGRNKYLIPDTLEVSLNSLLMEQQEKNSKGLRFPFATRIETVQRPDPHSL